MHELRLAGKTNKGKQRVKAHGPIWSILRTQESVLFSDRPGPWALIFANGDQRWVSLSDDANFEITREAD